MGMILEAEMLCHILPREFSHLRARLRITLGESAWIAGIDKDSAAAFFNNLSDYAIDRR